MEIEDIQIQNIDAGFHKVLKLISTREQVLESIPINNGRYYIIKTQEKVYLVAFKREFFMTFGKKFADKGESGVGETINTENLKQATAHYGATDIMFCYPSGKIYSISISDLVIKGHKRINDFENKETVSVSIKHLKRENEM
jgi:hypothetical protein